MLPVFFLPFFLHSFLSFFLSLSLTSVARSTDDGYRKNDNKEHASISALREWNGKALVYVYKGGGGKRGVEVSGEER